MGVQRKNSLSYQQSLFITCEGGLGIHKFSEIAPAASVISWLTHDDNHEMHVAMKSQHPQVQLKPPFSEFFANIMIFPIEKKLLELELVNEVGDLANPFIRIDSIRQINDKRKDTVQNILASSVQRMDKLQTNRRHRQVFSSLQNIHGWMPGP